MPYKRVILKLSGELLGDEQRDLGHLDFSKINELSGTLRELNQGGVQVGVVMGGGNIFRARRMEEESIDRVAADHMGMMATIINSLALQSSLEKQGVDGRVLSAIAMPEIMENYVHKRAINHLEQGRVIILAGGTGRPFFSTDTAAVIRALEVKADVVFKASNVEGIYDADPKTNPGARFYDQMTYSEALDKKLQIMDGSAFALARDNNLPIVVFKFSPDNILKAAHGEKVGTLVHA